MPMQIIKSAFLFYQKLLIPALIFCGAFALFGYASTGEFSPESIAISYVLISILLHFFVYELKDNNEYYFYYNLGLSRLVLWAITLLMSLSIGITLSILCANFTLIA